MVTSLPNFLGWVDLLTHGAPQARFARQSSAIIYGLYRPSPDLATRSKKRVPLELGMGRVYHHYSLYVQ